MSHAQKARPKSKKPAPKAALAAPAAHEEEELLVKTDALPIKPGRIVDLVDEEEVVAPVVDERAEGVALEEADGDEAPASDDEELDATELNPFGDKWEE